MKKFLSLSAVVRLVLLVEIILCAVGTLAVFMVNGTDAFGADHLLLLVLIAVTAASARLLKASKAIHQKAALWLSALPLFFISHQTVTAFLLSHHA